MGAAKLVLLLVVLFVVLVVAASPIPRLETAFSVPVYLASGKLLTNAHEVVGRVTGVSPINIQLAGAARFTNATSYFCVVSGADELQTLGPQVLNVDGAQFRILHASAEPARVVYRCIGI